MDVRSLAHNRLLSPISGKGDVINISISPALKHALPHTICRVAFCLAVYTHCIKCIRHKSLQMVNPCLPTRGETVSHVPAVLFRIILCMGIRIQEELCVVPFLFRLLLLLICNYCSHIADFRVVIIGKHL